MIIDTSYLIDLFAGRDAAFDRGLGLAAAGAIQRVPAPVVMELAYGAAFADAPKRRAVRNALRMYPVVDLDAELARRAGQLLTAADREPDGQRGIDKVDPMVATVAERYDEPVLTADVKDFKSLGVEVDSY